MAIYSPYSRILIVTFVILSSSFLSVSHGRRPVPPHINPNFRVKAVNLGGWLVTEGWIKPSLFDGIPNKDLLDGTGLQFKSVKVGKYLSAESGGGTIIVANRTNASSWETFKLWRNSETIFNFRVFNKQFVGIDKTAGGNGGTTLVATETNPGSSETFEIVRKSDDLNRVRIRAPNGYFLQVKTEELVSADFQGNSTWGDDDPSVFLIEFNGRLEGEFQVTNGYGPLNAPQVMREHWRTFIMEQDFKFISSNGLNTVRIPVGWWTAYPTPPKPFVAGSLQTLDNAFFWAEKYNLKVIIDLHCAPGSQNGWEHSGSRDGSQEWGQTSENIQQTVDVIDFLAARYAKRSSLLAIELINEPLSPGVSLENVTNYYKAGYDAVRKHTSNAYVILSNRLGPSKPTELLPLAGGMFKSAIDVHYYSLFDSVLSSYTVQQNVDYIKTNRSAQLSQISTSNGPLTFVGEWVAEWQVKGASKEDYQKFGAAQLEVVPPYINPNFQVRAVNLGGWLQVTEGWIKPSLFDGIPNKDLLDGTELHLNSVKVGKYLSVENGGGAKAVANRTTASSWETFRPWRINETNFNFRVFHKQFIGLDKAAGGKASTTLVATKTNPGLSETFEIVRKPGDLNRVRIKAPNGHFLQVNTEKLISADFEGDSKWADDDPSVFLIEVKGSPQGELQVTNGYGPLKLSSTSNENMQKRSSLLAIQLLNEPLAPIVSFQNITKYHKAGYEAVRKHTSTAYVILSAGLGSNASELFPLAVFFFFSALSGTTVYSQDVPFKAANLGGWLVVEGWMTPSLFDLDGVLNKDLLDGTQVQLKSTMLNKFLAAENGGGTNLVANRDTASGWETFTLWRIDENTFNLRVFNKQFVGIDDQSGSENVVATVSSPRSSETFQIERNPDDQFKVRIKAPNGLFLQAPDENTVVATYGDTSDWGDQNPSVFQMNIVRQITGEYQLTNAYGPVRASQVLQSHWNTYITEDDFKFMSDNGLTAVRIPVGWWIRYDQSPPLPFVGGSLQALDNAFDWAEKYGMKVIVDLHAVPGSQNPDAHSGTRDGNPEWGDSKIPETVQVIDFLAQRYSQRSSLGAIELMNEPREPYVQFATLSNYYQLGYDAVRKYTSNAYVILSKRLGNANSTEFLPIAGNMDRSVIDVHYYNLFSDQFNNLNIQQNIDFVRNTRAAELQEVTRTNGFPLSFVGEWTAAMAGSNFQDADYARFAQAQVEVYGKATFGWAYWSYKCDTCGMWSLRRMIERGLINLH
ncbi:OLC1v1017467C1 [Oldenlandia corymbosa var. corymbosa]|uniref:OLC1v1017467C1 n=1 Tax=Oldenlandia corymbosa var. corymbosa TaxID=529605 RepID=A0AAV1E9I7_OLDCO|nr:OLC1v1017467C1 [Oldenlandia corymbosa var. corymbosa]